LKGRHAWSRRRSVSLGVGPNRPEVPLHAYYHPVTRHGGLCMQSR
jgi:hypothetical protein